MKRYSKDIEEWLAKLPPDEQAFLRSDAWTPEEIRRIKSSAFSPTAALKAGDQIHAPDVPELHGRVITHIVDSTTTTP